jgi:hypothetical protein
MELTELEKELKWLEKERKKDTVEIKIHKNKIISEIKKSSKDDITIGPKKLPSKWKAFKAKIFQFFKF